jgi:hypothetical protein
VDRQSASGLFHLTGQKRRSGDGPRYPFSTSNANYQFEMGTVQFRTPSCLLAARIPIPFETPASFWNYANVPVAERARRAADDARHATVEAVRATADNTQR